MTHTPALQDVSELWMSVNVKKHYCESFPELNKGQEINVAELFRMKEAKVEAVGRFIQERVNMKR